MISGVLEGGIALLVAIGTAIFIFGQMRENARKNESDISDIKQMISEYQKSTQTLLEKSMDDMKELLNANRVNQKEALEREISHVQNLITLTTQEMHDDIRRIEVRLDEINKIREKTALLAASVKSLHHRLDIDLPSHLEDD